MVSSNASRSIAQRRQRRLNTIISQINTHRTEIQGLLDHGVPLDSVMEIMLDKYQLRASRHQYKRAIACWNGRLIRTRAQVRARDQMPNNNDKHRKGQKGSDDTTATSINSETRSDTDAIKKEIVDEPEAPKGIMDEIHKYNQTRRLEMTLGQWTEMSVMLVSLLLKGDHKEELLGHLRCIAQKQ